MFLHREGLSSLFPPSRSFEKRSGQPEGTSVLSIAGSPCMASKFVLIVVFLCVCVVYLQHATIAFQVLRV